MPAYKVNRDDEVGHVRRQALSFCGQIAFSPQEQAELAIIITELATNLARHATAGRLSVEALPGGKGVTIEALDEGPGIGDVTAALVDGASSKGSLGGGLGAIRRLADEFSIRSGPGGTEVKATKWAGEGRGNELEFGVYSRPHREHSCCDDGFWIQQDRLTTWLALFDNAHYPVERGAVWRRNSLEGALRSLQGLPLTDMVAMAHRQTFGGGGASLLLGRYDHRRHLLEYVAVGEISGALLWPGGWREVECQTGRVGHSLPPLILRRLPMTTGMVLAAATKGVALHWESIATADLKGGNLGDMCRQWVRTWGKQDDDATVLLARVRS
ncbi:hypothetical protein GTO91_11310 [Heliobacterium undosum]|uniref:Histidine kinase/HSP90-like ATPase domain-containing protein n=1 Tax=Heliomicrobium undosum TaxID=121734 RepID=A0A845L9B5_9FIRM|nr:ATP-binding protein [Heliomicrobium undosum]MZP30298.1 hypothetical protein [Heliomicrobium undosum]